MFALRCFKVLVFCRGSFYYSMKYFSNRIFKYNTGILSTVIIITRMLLLSSFESERHCFDCIFRALLRKAAELPKWIGSLNECSEIYPRFLRKNRQPTTPMIVADMQFQFRLFCSGSRAEVEVSPSWLLARDRLHSGLVASQSWGIVNSRIEWESISRQLQVSFETLHD